jgi:predicted lipid-binding transport protein (Tim44 family)
MPYCPKCGNLVDENMTFCPRCGAPLKAEATAKTQPQGPTPPYRRDEKTEKNEKNEHDEKTEKQEKGEHGGFIGFFIGGLILIIIGVFSLLSISGVLTSGANSALVLVLIGVVIIIAAVYVATNARRRSPQPKSQP